MRVIIVILVAALAALIGSCVDNEISLFIEHAKTQPEGPDCVVTVSDERAASGELDLAFGSGYGTVFLVQNQLMAREDYDNLVAETNGVFIDSYDVSLSIAENNQQLGVSERLPIPQYIEPETSDTVPATILPASVVAELAEAAGCGRIGEANYPARDMFATAVRRDANGLPVPRSLGTIDASVKFFAHSQGGADLETQRFTFPIHACCGCLVDWYLCEDPCERYCSDSDEFEEDKMCTRGIKNGEGEVDCRRYYHNTSASWSCTEYLENEDGGLEPHETTCNCDDC